MTVPKAALALAALFLAGCTRQPPATGAIQAVASFYPLYEFTQRIGGDRVRVANLVPAGAEPHDYEPSPQDVVAVGRARLLVYIGAGFEPWIDRLLPELPDTAARVEVTAGLPLVRRNAHVWVDPVLAQQIVDRILAGLIQADPAGREMYNAGALRLKEDLRLLHDAFAQQLASCRRRVFITSHDAFGYLARRYGLEAISIAGLTPEGDPSPSALASVVAAARAHRVTVIYHETLVSPRVAETIAREVGATTRVLNPLEGLTGDELRAGKNYFTVMYDNLRNLTDGLDCRA